MDMSGQMAEKRLHHFRYNDHGSTAIRRSERFADPDAFNAIFAEVSSEISEVMPATPGTATLSIASDDGLTLTVQNTQADRRSAIKKELAKQLPDSSDAQLDALLEGMIMTYRFYFSRSAHRL